MPLTHFLALIAVTILAAAVTLWAGLSAGVPRSPSCCWRSAVRCWCI